MFLKQPCNLVCATLLTGIYDVNRNETINEGDFSRVSLWYESIIQARLQGVIFHNTFSAETTERYTNEYITFIRVDIPDHLNANVARYLIYQDFIQANYNAIQHLFATDISDVEVVINPFTHPLFTSNPDALFCGDESKPLDNDWMNDHSTHLRQSIPDFAAYELANKQQTLLNCGVIGGRIDVMKKLIDQLAQLHRTYTVHNKTPYTLDMGAFNYVARTQFARHLIHGQPVNTRFKGYEADRLDCWFRHK